MSKDKQVIYWVFSSLMLNIALVIIGVSLLMTCYQKINYVEQLLVQNQIDTENILSVVEINRKEIIGISARMMTTGEDVVRLDIKRLKKDMCEDQ